MKKCNYLTLDGSHCNRNINNTSKCCWQHKLMNNQRGHHQRGGSPFKSSNVEKDFISIEYNVSPEIGTKSISFQEKIGSLLADRIKTIMNTPNLPKHSLYYRADDAENNRIDIYISGKDLITKFQNKVNSQISLSYNDTIYTFTFMPEEEYEFTHDY